MWGMLATLILGLLKWIFEKKAKQKLNDKQFVEFIEAHQAKRVDAGKTASNFEDALQETLSDMSKTSDKNK